MTVTNKSKLYFILILFILIASVCSKKTLIEDIPDPEENDQGHIQENIGYKGLYIAEGKLMKEGKTYKGIGVNYYDCFRRTLYSEGDISYIDGFRQLKNYKIPFVRFMAGGYWPTDYKLYLNDKNSYFEKLDRVIVTAEEFGIGLIPSLFWNSFTIPDIVEEPVGSWGDPNSKTIEFMKNYVGEVVSRYKNSSAIWGWEFGNEYNLRADLPLEEEYFPDVNVRLGTPSFRTKEDMLTTDDILIAMKEFYLTVREYDPYNRAVFSGNAYPRRNAFHLNKHQAWDRDTKSENSWVLSKQNEPFNSLEVHLYPRSAIEFQYFSDIPANYEKMLEVAMQTSIRKNKPLFVGEFGVAEVDIRNGEGEHSTFLMVLDAIEKYDVPLAAMWVYDASQFDGYINVTAYNSRSYMLKEIQKLNERR
jgi:hypothetical protein